MKRILPPMLWMACLVAMAVLAYVVQGDAILAAPYHQAGWGLFVAGVAATVFASRQFRTARTNIHTFGKPDRLVTTGLFAISRNPMYLGFFGSLVGAAIGFNSLFAFGPALVFFLAAEFWYIPYEERAAEQAFGGAYVDYRRRVRRWIGRGAA